MEWHPFAEKFPLLEGEDWKSFKESIKKTGGNEQPVVYRMVKGKKQGLDGRNRLKACEELGLECRMHRMFIEDGQVKDYILRRNVHRRHLTPELRRQIVAELWADGQSTRQIAGSLGVSHTTVERDLKPTLKVESGTNVPKTTTPVRDPADEIPQAPKAIKPPREPGDDTDQIQADKKAAKTAPKNGQELFNWRDFHHDFGKLMQQVDRFGNAYKCKETFTANQLRANLQSWQTDFKAWTKSLTKQIPPER